MSASKHTLGALILGWILVLTVSSCGTSGGGTASVEGGGGGAYTGVSSGSSPTGGDRWWVNAPVEGSAKAESPEGN